MTITVLNANCHGIGDLCLTSWISEASKGKDHELIHYATGEKRIVLEMLGQKVCEEHHTMTNTFESYKWELEHPDIPRVESRASQLGFYEWSRPSVHIKPQYHEWAEKQHDKRKKLVLLFPRSIYENRCWPVPYWIDLSWWMVKFGHDVKVILHAPDDRFKNAVPYLYHSQDWRCITALMLRSSLIIGNDSGPVHIGGTLNVPCLALLGPTPPNIFQHLPSVQTISNPNMACTGCFYKTPHYRVSCNVGCSSLYGLSAETVAERAIELLNFGGMKGRSGPHWKEDMYVMRAVIQEDEYHVKEIQNPGDVVVDVGAHIGSFTHQWKTHQNRDATFGCVEVCPENWNLLRENVGEYATIFEAACCYEHEDMYLMNSVMDNGDATGGSILSLATKEFQDISKNKYWKDTRPIRKITLEEIMKDLNADHIDVLKLDCEGSEYSILYGTESLDKIRMIVGESHGQKQFEQLVKDKFPSDRWQWIDFKRTSDDLGLFHLINKKFNPFASDLRRAFIKDDISFFVHWITRYRTLFELYSLIRPRSVIEIGVRAGYSAWTYFQTMPNGRLLGIDFDGDQNVVNTHGGFHGAYKHAKDICGKYDFEIQIADTRTLTELPPSDLVYIDGDHTTEGCYHDLCLAETSAKWIMCDDYDTLFGGEQLVRIAIDKFCKERGIKGEYYDNEATGLYLIQIP